MWLNTPEAKIFMICALKEESILGSDILYAIFQKEQKENEERIELDEPCLYSGTVESGHGPI